MNSTRDYETHVLVTFTIVMLVLAAGGVLQVLHLVG